MKQKQTKKTVSKVNQQVNQKSSQRRPKDNSTKYLCLFVVVIAFTLAFALLINKQNGNSDMYDIEGKGFNVKPEAGKVIVARDMGAIYPKYFVAYVDLDEFSIYVYNYYETSSQYELEYNRLIDDIVDYNAKEKMIRYLFGRGYSTYDELLANLSSITNCNNLRIY